MAPFEVAETFLIDSSSFRGESGGLREKTGVITSKQRQSDKTKTPFEERTVLTPLGLRIAVQPPFLRERLEPEWCLGIPNDKSA